MHKYLTIPLFLALLFAVGGVAEKYYVVASLGWAIGMAILFFIPKTGENMGWFSSKKIANSYFLTGLLMVAAGALGAGFAISQLKLQADQLAIAKFAVLASSALPGGALCADAILGLDIEASQKRISLGFSLIFGGVFALAVAVCIVFLKKGGDFPDLKYFNFYLHTIGASLLSCLGPILGAYAIQRMEEARHTSTFRSADMLALSGVLGIGASIMALFITKSAMPMLDLGGAAETFVDEILPAYGATVSACLLAKALEINRLAFDEEEWLRRIGVALTNNGGYEISTNGRNQKILKISANSAFNLKVDVEVSLSGPVRKRLAEGGGLIRFAIFELAMKYLKNKFHKSPEATHFSIKEDILTALEGYGS
ncbi:hypothetical protein [Burkholderia sp. F1]|uniref:hypothetical protein n=1 Tax=Burkholderia sp. F1 TaxID=3366817 RepID=UPI003D759224